MGAAGRKRLLKQRQLGRYKGEDHKKPAYQAQHCQRQPFAPANQKTFLQQPFKAKDGGCGDIENGDIDPIGGRGDGAVVGVKQQRDQRKARQACP